MKYPLNIPVVCSLLAALFCTPLGAEEAPLWRSDAATFQQADDPYLGWKVTDGAAETTEEAIALSPNVEPFTRLHHYIPNHSGAAQSGYYLQIRASFDTEAHGEAANVSEGGGRLGPWVSGLTTYDLAAMPYFQKAAGEGHKWALSLMTGSPAQIASLTTRNHLDEGITLELAGGPEAIAVEGDEVIVTVRTTDPEVARAERLEAQLVCHTSETPRRIVSWDGCGGPALSLQRSAEGVFTTTFRLDAATIALLARPELKAKLGVQAETGSLQQLGWAGFRTESSAEGEKGHTAVIDWQYRIGEPTESQREWAELTQGEELARNRRVKLIPPPDYHLTTDGNDVLDLTDGRLSPRRDDRIWFSRETVGWYGTGGAVPSVMLVIDLEKEQPVGQIAIRLLAGREQSGLRLPNELEFLASRDGKTYHSLQSMQKLMPAERDLSDFKTAFYVPEDGKAFVQAFVCRQAVMARYIAIRIAPEASAFSDEISIQKAPEGSSFTALENFPAREVYTEGFVARPRQPEFTLTEGVMTYNWIVLENCSEKPYRTLGLELHLPDGVRLLADKAFPTTAKPAPDGKGTIHTFSELEKIPGMRFPIYLETEEGGEMAESTVTLVPQVDGMPSHRISYPLRVRKMPQGPFPDHLSISLAWMGQQHQMAWPRFMQDFRKLGFNTISSFPRYWQQRNAERSWIDRSRDEGLALLRQGREGGYKVVMNDSPFHEMVHTFEAAERQGLLKPEEKTDFYLQDASGQLTPYVNPFYQGRFYDLEMERIATLVKATAPDHLYLDIELWWKSALRAKDDERIRKAWEASGKAWEDFLTDSGARMLRDIREATGKGMASHQGPLPVTGLYGAYATEKTPTDGVFNWKKIYPDLIQISMPSLYVQGRTADVANRIRDEYPLVGRRVIPWLTAGTYGPVAPPAMEAMVLESILNGAEGVTYYEYGDFDPLHFYYHTLALSKLGRFPELLRNGAPQPYEGNNPDLHYTCFASGDEALILVGNYNRTPRTGTRLHTHLEGAETTRVDDNAANAANAAPSWSTRDAQWEADVPPGTFRLFHQKRHSSP